MYGRIMSIQLVPCRPGPAAGGLAPRVACPETCPTETMQPGGKDAVSLVVVVQSQTDLFQIVAALAFGGPPRVAACTAGSNSATRMPMIVMTTSNSTRVKPCRAGES